MFKKLKDFAPIIAAGVVACLIKIKEGIDEQREEERIVDIETRLALLESREEEQEEEES